MSLTLHLLDPWSLADNDLAAGLTPAERRQADRFVFPRDAQRWSGYRTLARRILAQYLDLPALELEWELSANGKPFLPGKPLHFNLSHTDALGLLAVSSEGPVGVDLEATDRAADLIDCEAAFCHPSELQEIEDLSEEDRAGALIRIWTSKEAALKCLGTGLSHPPQEVRITGERVSGSLEGLAGLHLLHPEHQRLSEYTCAVATDRENTRYRWA